MTFAKFAGLFLDLHGALASGRQVARVAVVLLVVRRRVHDSRSDIRFSGHWRIRPENHRDTASSSFSAHAAFFSVHCLRR